MYDNLPIGIEYRVIDGFGNEILGPIGNLDAARKAQDSRGRGGAEIQQRDLFSMQLASEWRAYRDDKEQKNESPD